ncbi:NAD(P)-binding protein [Pleurostoma richardsiae]|uniref:NAD(P)-binding protein n=1 Tax=Pleurostoma richardsiae TaxID=41990 RepID=A0AA38R9A5_9PEZI|nr:NAD(P)-binding protein [Pleurostoma richardsiae]
MQSAVFLEAIGKPLVLRERRIPEPRSGWVLIKIESAMILPHDQKSWTLGLFVGDKLPYVLGHNIAGTVVRLGEDVTGYQVGDRVFGMGRADLSLPDSAGLQQYALLDITTTAKIPDGTSFDQAAGYPINASTSAIALFSPKGFDLPPPFSIPSPSHLGDTLTPDLTPNRSKTFVVVGAGANTGKQFMQMARLAGVSRIIAIASAKNEATLRRLGASHIVDRHLPTDVINATVRAILNDGNDGALNVYDCVSADHVLALSLLSRKNKEARLVILLRNPETRALAEREGLDVRHILAWPEWLEPLNGVFWAALPKWIADGKLEGPEYRVIDGLDVRAIEEGLKSYADGGAVPQVVVRPH